MLELFKLEQSDFELLKSWIKSKDELMQFAGPAILQFPITDEQLQCYIIDDRRVVYKVILSETNEIIGNAELNFENQRPRLSRILIGEARNRNKGFGKQIVNKLLEKLFMEYTFLEADLNVYDWNKSAIKCYENVGFVINPELVNTQTSCGTTWTALNMIITKERWLENRLT
jgi:RimJ/RimL family protein N-acetyltransferase